MDDMNPIIRKVSRSGKAGECGSALVEAALTAPLLLLMLLGATEFGRVAYMSIQVSNAAKAAVQYGAQNQITAIDTAGMQKVAQLEVSSLISSGVTVTVNTAANCSCSSPDTSTTPFNCLDATTLSCASPSFVEQTLSVTVTAPFDPLIHVTGLPGPFTLKGHAVQKRLN
jgi:Flp pilus assembly protein TadG